MPRRASATRRKASTRRPSSPWAGVHYGTKADPRYIGIWTANPKPDNVSTSSRSSRRTIRIGSTRRLPNLGSVRSSASIRPDLDGVSLRLSRDDAPVDYLSGRRDEAGRLPETVRHPGQRKGTSRPACRDRARTTPAHHAPTLDQVRIDRRSGVARSDGTLARRGPGRLRRVPCKTYMQKNRVRRRALAVVKGTRLVLARGYTGAEPPYPVTQPDSIFRIASCSKLWIATAMSCNSAELNNAAAQADRHGVRTACRIAISPPISGTELP